MAAQCRSPRCTAERKGFRRELDSWRHRLIHCVGFESILEGLYGSGLRRDLSLFDDCEPEELVDWCVDEKCSLCSLHKETVDSSPSGGSAQSTPTEEVISQGQLETEKSECQAENYLNALFQKKDLPQNCEPNIPLVAQELMKKMIRQFAIEYVSKSRKMHQDNGAMVDSPLSCNGIQMNHSESLIQEEQDSPLDLTITRIEEQCFQDEDGALDLSVKRNGTGIEQNSKIRNLKLGGYFLRKLKKATKVQEETTTLAKVLALYCPYHQQQLVLMLKFLREEKKICSQTYCRPKTHRPAILKRSKKSPAACCCVKKKLGPQVNLHEQMPNASLPYPSVRLKDLRLTMPNLTLGTVKLNPIKNENLHLTANDRVLHCINTRSKKEKLVINSSNGYRSVCSSFPLLKLQRVAMPLNRDLVEYDLKYCNNSASSSVRNQSCQTAAGTIKTVNENLNLEKSLCDVKQNNPNPTVNTATTLEDSQDKAKIGSVRFGYVFRHLLSNSGVSHFAELLNQDVRDLQSAGVQTRWSKSKKKQVLFDGSLSSGKMFESSSIRNKVCDFFPKENISSGKDFLNLETTTSKEEHGNDLSIMNKSESTHTHTVGAAWENKTELPHCKLSLRSKNVSCLKRSQPCLPECYKVTARENVMDRHKRCTSPAIVESGISFKRYSKNILGKCKMCDVPHGQWSVSKKSNLFCKCTVRNNSGISMNVKPIGPLGRNTTDKVRKGHLKVVIKRLDEALWSGTKRKNESMGNCKIRKTQLDQGNFQELPSEWPVDQVNTVRPGSSFSTRSSTQKGKMDSKAVTENLHEVSGNPNLYSPIKLMYVSKVKTEDGVKYALSSVYTPSEQNGNQQQLCPLSNPSNTENKKSSYSDNTNDFCLSEAETSFTLNHCEGLHDPNKLGQQASRNITRSIRNTRSKTSSNNINSKKNDFNISIPNCVKVSQISDNLRSSSTTKTYVAKNISSTQIKIQLRKLPESFVTSDTRVVEYSGNHILSQRDTCNVSLRVSPRLQTLGKLSNSYGMWKTSNCNSKNEQRKDRSLSNVSWERAGEANNHESCEANNFESCQSVQNQKTKLEKLKLLKSRLIRNRIVSEYFTRSRKLSCFNTQHKVLNTSRKLHLDKSKRYRRKLRSYKEPTKPPLVNLCTSEDTEQTPSFSSDDDPPSTAILEWWSTATANEALINHLDSRYEHIAKTWVVKNEDKTYSSSALKSSSAEESSAIQMLFKKKCDLNALATWFMQTTETQSLPIVRQASTHNPHHKKGSTKKPNQANINSFGAKNHLELLPLKESEALDELHRVSKFYSSEKNSSKLRKQKRKNNLHFESLNSLHRSSENDEGVCAKRACSEAISDVTENVCAVKTSHAKGPAKETVKSTRKNLENANDTATVHGPTLIDAASKEPHFSKTQMVALSENEHISKKAHATLYCSNKLSTKDCRIFVTKLRDRELHTHKPSATGNSKCTRILNLTFKSDFSTKKHLKFDKPLAKPQSLISDSLRSKKHRHDISLRNLRRTVVWYNCGASVPEKRNSTNVSFLERNKNSPRKPQLVTGKVQSDYPKLAMGPVKPVGFPATRGLSSKYGSYSLAPIRITQSQ